MNHEHEDEYKDILDYVFDNGHITSGDERGAVDPNEVEACVKFEAEERGLDPKAAWEFARTHIISR